MLRLLLSLRPASYARVIARNQSHTEYVERKGWLFGAKADLCRVTDRRLIFGHLFAFPRERGALRPHTTKSSPDEARRGKSKGSADDTPSDVSRPSIRPHVKRDQIRMRKAMHAIRKVTAPASVPRRKLEGTTTGPSRFQKLNLMGPLVDAVAELGWQRPTPIQSAAIPVIIRGHNVISSAETGTGKTAAYGLPMLHRLYIWKRHEEKLGIERLNAPLCVVLCPTRELCEQVEDHVYQCARKMGAIRIVGLSGAFRDMDAQLRALKKGVDILVATPGRLITLLNEEEEDEVAEDGSAKKELRAGWDKAWGELETASRAKRKQKGFKEALPFVAPGESVKNANIDLSQVKCFVLDEADRMLSMGMLPEVRHIFKSLPRPRGKESVDRMQVLMFTATLVPRVGELVRRFAPHHVRLDLNRTMGTVENVAQIFHAVGNRRKYALLSYLLRRRGSMKDAQVLVFCRTQQRVERLVQHLREDGISAAGVHGSQPAASRQQIIDAFREQTYRVLVSTDLMSRGIDIPKLPFVVNYDLPHDPEEYVHRIGRTARAGESGKAISFVAKSASVLELGKRLVELDEMSLAKSISDFLKAPLHLSKVPGPWRDEARRSVEEEIDRTPILLDTKTDLPSGPLRDRRSPDDAPPRRDLRARTRELLRKWYEKRRRSGKSSTLRSGSSSSRHNTKRRIGLRDFKEGRYEDTLFQFDARRARKLGVHVPNNMNEALDRKRKKIHKKWQRKRA